MKPASIIIVVMLFALSAFYIWDLKHTQAHENVLFFESHEEQEKFIEKLKEKNIEFIVDKERKVFYSDDVKVKVKALFEKVRSGVPIGKNYITYPNQDHLEIARGALDRNHVKYEILEYKGEKVISLSTADDNVWQPVLDQAEKEFMF